MDKLKRWYDKTMFDKRPYVPYSIYAQDEFDDPGDYRAMKAQADEAVRALQEFIQDPANRNPHINMERVAKLLIAEDKTGDPVYLKPGDIRKDIKYFHPWLSG